MKNITIEVKDNIFEQVNEILDGYDMDMEIAVKMFFKRIIREKSFSFMLSKDTCSGVQQNAYFENNVEKLTQDKVEMRKTIAIRLFRERRKIITNSVTYASKNRTTHNFWANPSFSVLKSDWSLILNDWISRKLYLFFIPQNSISEALLVPRNDQKQLIDLQILENIPGFIDKRSGLSFEKFLIDKVEY